jgi:hypothetical protein
MSGGVCGGILSSSPAPAVTGWGRGRVSRRRGVTQMLKVLAGGPGAACAGGAARVLGRLRVCDVRRHRHGVAGTGRVRSGQCRAPPRPGLALACSVGCGGIIWQGGQVGEGRGEEVVRQGGDMAGMAMSMPC